MADTNECPGCGRDPALGDQVIDGRVWCHWSPSSGATCYTAKLARDRVEARRVAGFPPSLVDMVGILPTNPDDVPCVCCGIGANEYCRADLHAYCFICVGRGHDDPCDACVSA